MVYHKFQKAMKPMRKQNLTFSDGTKLKRFFFTRRPTLDLFKLNVKQWAVLTPLNWSGPLSAIIRAMC